jgi:outer membrane receptor protein involved in Fe transport
MMHRAFVLLLAGTSLAAVATQAEAADSAAPAPRVSAEQATPVAAVSSQDIVVTAQKRPQILLDVPQSVSVISGDKLEAQHAQRLSDYLTKIPSANIVESQAGQSRIVLRGINTGGVGATVATYIDEAPFGSATSLANGAVDVPDLDPFDLARVEVLRGPQGTLYGANSLGGLVKYVTVAPEPGVFDGAAEAGVEDVHHGDLGWWGRAAGNFSLGSNAAIRASGFYRSDPGYIDDPHLGKDVNDGSTYGGRLSLLIQPSSALRIRASVLAQNIRSNGTNTVDLDPATLKPSICDLCHLRFIDEPNDIDYRLYNGTIDYDFGPLSLVSATSYGTLDQATSLDASGVYGPILTFFLGTPLGAGLDQGMKQRRFTQEVRLASNGVTAIEWTVGGFYTHEKNRLSQNLFGIVDPTGDRVPGLDGLVIVDLPSTYEEVAGFANATWHLAPKFDLTAGGRYSHNRQTVVQNTSGLLAGGDNSFDGESSDNVFTYSVAPSFAPNKHTRIYARVAKGYRPGGPNAVSPLAPTGVPRSFGPDTTTNYEVGVKSETADHRLAFEVTAFLIDWKNIQLLAQVENFGVNTNGGSARSKGVEFNVSARPIPDLSLYANGAYVDAYLTSDAPPIVGGLRGDSLPYNPKFSSTIGAEYDHPLSAAMTGHAGISWHYTGRRRSDFDAAVGQQRLKAFGQVDAHLGVDIDRFAIDAFVHNLTDSRGIVNLGTLGSAPNGDFAASVIRPRTIGISLRVRY